MFIYHLFLSNETGYYMALFSRHTDTFCHLVTLLLPIWWSVTEDCLEVNCLTLQILFTGSTYQLSAAYYTCYHTYSDSAVLLLARFIGSAKRQHVPQSSNSATPWSFIKERRLFAIVSVLDAINLPWCFNAQPQGKLYGRVLCAAGALDYYCGLQSINTIYLIQPVCVVSMDTGFPYRPPTYKRYF